MTLADAYAQSKGFLDARSMVKHLNDTKDGSQGELIYTMIQGEIVNALRVIDNNTRPGDPE